MMTETRPSYKKVLRFAQNVVKEEAVNPSRGQYDRQIVEHEILNHFGGLTNSDEDYDLIIDAIREAEAEYNESNECEL